MLLFKGDNYDDNIELAIDIVSAKPNGEKLPLTKSSLRTIKSLVKSFTNNRNINTTLNNNRRITYKINNNFYIFRLRIQY